MNIDEDLQKYLDDKKNNTIKKIVDDIKKEFKDVKNITDDIIYEIYCKCNSIRQKNVRNKGNDLEEFVDQMLDKYNIKHDIQVSIDKNGDIIKRGTCECYHIIDFVIGDIKIGSNITDYIVLSTKTSCKERWTQDNWTLDIQPKKYILATLTRDYPSSKRFRESKKRFIITLQPKKRDDRTYKYSYNDIINLLPEYKNVNIIYNTLGMSMENNIKFIDLFCGIGSFHYSLSKCGYECSMACDINKSSRDTYTHNYKIKPLKDILDIKPSKKYNANIICAGFPYQHVSTQHV